MSKFFTKIPFDPVAVISRLPKGSTVLGLTLAGDARSVELAWEHDTIPCLYTTAVHWEDPGGEEPPEVALARGSMPKAEVPGKPAPDGLAPAAAKMRPAADVEADRARPPKRNPVVRAARVAGSRSAGGR